MSGRNPPVHVGVSVQKCTRYTATNARRARIDLSLARILSRDSTSDKMNRAQDLSDPAVFVLERR